MDPAYKDELATVYLAADVDGLKEIPDGTVSLVITSPPYNLGVSSGSGFADPGQATGKWSGGKLATGYGVHDDAMPMEEYVAWQKNVLRTLWDKLTDDGAIFYNHKPRVQNRELWMPLELNPGLPLRQIIIWKRPGGINFSPTHFCPTHEWIMLFAKKGYELRDRSVSGLFGDVWDMTPDHGSSHPAPFPLDLPARAIMSSANVETVLDPYCGSGTTLRAATDAGVKSIGIDNDPACVELTRERLAQMNLFGVS